jgi:hypothetical protein
MALTLAANALAPNRIPDAVKPRRHAMSVSSRLTWVLCCHQGALEPRAAMSASVLPVLPVSPRPESIGRIARGWTREEQMIDVPLIHDVWW